MSSTSCLRPSPTGLGLLTLSSLTCVPWASCLSSGWTVSICSGPTGQPLTLFSRVLMASNGPAIPSTMVFSIPGSMPCARRVTLSSKCSPARLVTVLKTSTTHVGVITRVATLAAPIKGVAPDVPLRMKCMNMDVGGNAEQRRTCPLSTLSSLSWTALTSLFCVCRAVLLGGE